MCNADSPENQPLKAENGSDGAAAHRFGRRGFLGAAVGAASFAAAGIVLFNSATLGGAKTAFGVSQVNDQARDDALARAFEARGDETISRSATRDELSRALSEQRAMDRGSELGDYQASINDVTTQSMAQQRDQASAEELAKVRANAKKLAAEKREAERQLADLAKSAGVSAVDGQTVSLSVPGTVVAPMKAGTYHVGAHFGARGVWSNYHTGVDMVAPTGTPVYATEDSIVGTSVSGGWAGTHIVLHHADGSSNLYAHLSSRSVSAGQFVKAGQLIGHVGNTGRSFGSHLHFEYYPKGTTPGDVYSAGDPVSWLRRKGIRI